LLTLMIAQRFGQSKIDAVEIDEQAFDEAVFNINESEWSDRIQIHHQSLQEFVSLNKKYDLIVSNPPYYKTESSYKITGAQRSKARQTETLSFGDLLNGIYHLLTDEGICWIVLPAQESETLIAKARTVELYLNSQILIHSKLSKAYNRVIFSLSKNEKNIEQSTFLIYDEDGKYTSQYTEVTMPFLLWKD
jgi:tRNA1Val (adenine37-N6)-methyltransferase